MGSSGVGMSRHQRGRARRAPARRRAWSPMGAQRGRDLARRRRPEGLGRPAAAGRARKPSPRARETARRRRRPQAAGGCGGRGRSAPPPRRSPKVASSRRDRGGDRAVEPAVEGSAATSVVADAAAGAAQAGREDAGDVARREPPCAKRSPSAGRLSTPKASSSSASAPSVRRSGSARPSTMSGDLAAVAVGHAEPPQSAVKASAPADSSARSKVTSPAWSPRYSRLVIWNGPAIVPKSGTIDLPVADRAVEEDLAHQRVRGLVLEDAGAGDAGAPHAGAGQQLAPAPGRFRRG